MTEDPFLQRFHEKRQAREQADRSFVLAGETLTHKPAVAPEVGMRLEAAQEKHREILTAMRAEAEKLEKKAKSNGHEVAVSDALVDALAAVERSEQASFEVADEVVLACLDEGSHEAWARLRATGAAHPLTFDEVFEIVGYLLGRVAGIPTDAPSGSSDGREQTGKPSKAVSSSRARTPTGSR